MSGHKQVTTSTPVSTPRAAFHNDTVAAINYAQKMTRRQLSSSVPEIGDLDNTVVVKNDSGSDAIALAVLGIGAPVVLPTASEMLFLSRMAIKGVTLTADHVGKFVILAEPIKSGKIGLGWISGVCPAKISVVDTDHECADIVDGALKSCESGICQILWKDTGTGTKAAMLRFGGSIVPDGTATSDMLYWNNTTKAWVILSPPASDDNKYVLSITNGVLSWNSTGPYSCPE